MTSPTTGNAVHDAGASFDQASWDRWLARGRAHDVAFRRKVRIVAIVLAVIAAAAAIWLFSGTA